MKQVSNILVIDDHLVVRKGIELVIKNNFKNTKIFMAESYDKAIDILKKQDIDLILLDIIINGVEDITILERIKFISKESKILVFSCHDEDIYGFRYIKNGANGYLNKFCPEQTFVDAVNSVFEFGSYYSDSLEAKIKKTKFSKSTFNPLEKLSNREFEVANLLVEGSGNLEIANKLSLQMSTISTYKVRIFEKLDINNIVALASFFKKDNL